MRLSCEIVHGVALYRATCNGLALGAEISPATQWATVYRDDDKPAATLQRARVYSSEPAWRAYALDGTQIGDGFSSPLKALRAVTRHALAREAAAFRSRMGQAALWNLYRYGAAS